MCPSLVRGTQLLNPASGSGPLRPLVSVDSDGGASAAAKPGAS